MTTQARKRLINDYKKIKNEQETNLTVMAQPNAD